MRAPTRRSLRRVAAAALAVGALATTAVPAAGAGPRDQARSGAAFPVAVASDFDYAGVPERVRPGTYDFTFVNSSREQFHELALFKVGKGTTRADVVAAADNLDEAFFSDFRGGSFAEPLAVQRPEDFGDFFAGRADLSDPGRYVYLCFIPDSETGRPHYQLGMLDFVDVK